MSDVKTFENNAGGANHLKLEVFTTLTVCNLDSIQPLWRTMISAGLIGSYRLMLRKKTQGVNGLKHVTKIIGLHDQFEMVIVKFQASSEDAFEGLLSKKKNDQNSVYGSRLLSSLKAVAGTAWFNPDQPQHKHVTHEKKSEGFVHVADAIKQPLKPVVEVKPAISTPKSNIAGFTKDLDLVKVLFEDLVVRSDDGLITSEIFTTTLMEMTAVGEQSRRSAGPVVTKFRRNGWLEVFSGKSPKMVYKITQKAFDDLKLHKPNLLDVKSASAHHGQKPKTGFDKMLVALMAKVEEITVAKARLSAVKAEIENLKAEEVKLEAFLDEPDNISVQNAASQMVALKNSSI